MRKIFFALAAVLVTASATQAGPLGLFGNRCQSCQQSRGFHPIRNIVERVRTREPMQLALPAFDGSFVRSVLPIARKECKSCDALNAARADQGK